MYGDGEQEQVKLNYLLNVVNAVLCIDQKSCEYPSFLKHTCLRVCGLMIWQWRDISGVRVGFASPQI